MMHHHNHLPGSPCLHCHPHTYIRMVQHLIERCLLLHMSRDQCIKALAYHASITPLITLTVWRELQKENQNFFQAYYHSISPIRHSRMSMSMFRAYSTHNFFKTDLTITTD